jgi:hypothetical protein
MSIAPYLIPTESGLNLPVLRHPDLNFENILLSPGSSEIAGVIDWQDSIIFPFSLQAGYPAFCEHDSPRLQSLQVPSLPENFTFLSDEEKTQAMAKYRLEEMNL